jgi:hypothetical protein
MGKHSIISNFHWRKIRDWRRLLKSEDMIDDAVRLSGFRIGNWQFKITNLQFLRNKHIITNCSLLFTYGTLRPLYTNYEGRLKSSWNRLTAPNRNFVEVQWRTLFRGTSLHKRRTSYNAPPISRKRAADRWSLRNFLPQSSLLIFLKAQKIACGEIWTVWRMF